MVQIIQPGSIKATNNIHDIVKDNLLVECPLLRRGPRCIYSTPFSILNFIAKKIIETLLGSVNSTKYKDCFLHDDSLVSIARFRSDAFESPYFEPKIRWKAVLINVIHCIVPIPAANDKHGVVADDCCMTEAIQRLRPRSLDLLPLIFLFLQSALP